MKAIYKYVVPFDNYPTINMHTIYELLHVDNQNEQFCLWAIVDPESEKVETKFTIVGTGQRFDDYLDYDYVGSALFQGGLYVWHLFREVDV